MNVHFEDASSAEMNRAIQRLADEAGKTAREVIVPQSRLFCTDLAYNTKPIGKTAAEGKKLREEIVKRINLIYLPVGAAVNMLKRKSPRLGVAFQRMLRSGDFSGAAAMMNRQFPSAQWEVGPFDGGDLHKDQRFRRHVTKRMVVTEKGRLSIYRRETAKLAGFAKGGFAAAARDLGGVRGIPGYATRQKAPGRASVTGTGSTLTVSIQNDVRHIRDALDSQGEARAMKHRARSITAVLKRMGDRKFKSASRSIR